jgi:hypothetical protein
VIANPERGFYENFSGFDYLHPQDFDADYIEWLTDPEYDSWRFGGGYLELLRESGKDQVTMLDVNIYLNDYINSPELPQSFVTKISRALQVVREAGMKITMRMVYADEWTPMVVERNYLRHVEQIGAVVTENADIVHSLSAGVFGPWGEWHNDDDYVMVDNYSYLRAERPEYARGVPTTDIDSPEQGVRRYRLVKRLLDRTPDTVPILIRSVEFLMELQALAKKPPSGEAALTQAQLDRLGLHDDSFASFVLSYTRGGGWVEKFYPYWDGYKEYDQVKDVAAVAAQLKTSSGGDVLQSGETGWYPEDYDFFDPDDPLNNTRVLDAGGQLALSESASRKLTMINRSWNAYHIQFWKDSGLKASGNDPAESAYTRLDRKLGYRLRLDVAEFTTSAKTGDNFGISATIHNDGYAGIIRQRPVFVVFDNGVNRYNIELTGVDARTWRSGANSLDAALPLPENMAAGEYAVALWLPDYYENLRGMPEYSVRFANKGLWCGSKGYNYLGTIEYQGDGKSAVNPLSDEFIAELGIDPDHSGGGSSPTPDPTPVPEVGLAFSKVGTPTISGTAKVGSTLKVSSKGTWKPTTSSYAYQWLRGGVEIPGATASTYTLAPADANALIQAKVKASKPGYKDTWSNVSKATKKVALGALSTKTPKVMNTATGKEATKADPKYGQILQADPGVWGPAGVKFSYLWYRSGKAVADVTGDTYPLTASDIGKTIKVKVTGALDGYQSASKTSTASKKVVALSFTAATPVVSGTLQVGQTLTANLGTWSPLPDLPLSYQWYSSGKAIKGATGDTYTLTKSDKGKTIKVKVTGTKLGYTDKSVTSKDTKKVTA